ncbi:hypothetical protein ACA910_003513 [Epithemia clementina (nom. ined.)]
MSHRRKVPGLCRLDRSLVQGGRQFGGFFLARWNIMVLTMVISIKTAARSFSNRAVSTRAFKTFWFLTREEAIQGRDVRPYRWVFGTRVIVATQIVAQHRVLVLVSTAIPA